MQAILSFAVFVEVGYRPRFPTRLAGFGINHWIDDTAIPADSQLACKSQLCPGTYPKKWKEYQLHTSFQYVAKHALVSSRKRNIGELNP